MSKRSPLKKVAVVGTGILGAQIAMIAAHTGLATAPESDKVMEERYRTQLY